MEQRINLQRVESQMDAMQASVDGMEDRLVKLDESIRGNGTPGLVAQGLLMDRRVATCEDFVIEFKSMRKWVILAILSLFGSAAWRVVEWLFQSQAF